MVYFMDFKFGEDLLFDRELNLKFKLWMKSKWFLIMLESKCCNYFFL